MNVRPYLPAVLTICCAFLASVVISSPQGTPDTEIGLSKSSVFEVPNPDGVALNTSDPGDESVIEPAFPGSPPLVPHGVEGFLPITRDENQCVDCHMVETKEAGEPTPIPESHFRDLRNAPDTVREDIAGARYVCTTCHTAMTRAEPLVGNGF